MKETLYIKTKHYLILKRFVFFFQQLEQQLNDLEIKVRVQINEEYETDLQQANNQRRQVSFSFLMDSLFTLCSYQFEDQFYTVENDLQNAMKTIEVRFLFCFIFLTFIYLLEIQKRY